MQNYHKNKKKSIRKKIAMKMNEYQKLHLLLSLPLDDYTACFPFIILILIVACFFLSLAKRDTRDSSIFINYRNSNRNYSLLLAFVEIRDNFRYDYNFLNVLANLLFRLTLSCGYFFRAFS